METEQTMNNEKMKKKELTTYVAANALRSVVVRNVLYCIMVYRRRPCSKSWGGVQMRQLVIAANDRPNKTQFSIFVSMTLFVCIPSHTNHDDNGNNR
jgi:hypothetical protein